MLAREGLHTGAWQWALLKRTPRAANRSILGVLAWGCPPRQPIQSLRSSMEISRTLGLPSSTFLSANKQVNRQANARVKKLLLIIHFFVKEFGWVSKRLCSEKKNFLLSNPNYFSGQLDFNSLINMETVALPLPDRLMLRFRGSGKAKWVDTAATYHWNRECQNKYQSPGQGA